MFAFISTKSDRICPWICKVSLQCIYNIVMFVCIYKMSAPKRYFLFVFPWSEMSHFHWFNIARDCLIYLYVCSVKINIWQYGRLTRRPPSHFDISYYLLLTPHAESSWNIWSGSPLKSLKIRVAALWILTSHYCVLDRTNSNVNIAQISAKEREKTFKLNSNKTL